MADEQFNSKLVVDVKGGFDAGKLKGKSVVVTGGIAQLFIQGLQQTFLIARQVRAGWARRWFDNSSKPGITHLIFVTKLLHKHQLTKRQRLRNHRRPLGRTLRLHRQ